MPDKNAINRDTLRKLLGQHFSLGELGLLCASLDEEFDAIVPQNATLPEAALALVNYFHRRARLPQLVAAAQDQRKGVDWRAIYVASSLEEMATFARPRNVVLNAAPLVFEQAGKMDVEAERKLPPMRDFISRPEHFTGRSADTQRVIAAVLGGRMATVKGAPGIGKTALTIEAAHYLNERHAFRDGCAFVQLRGVDSADGLRAAAAKALDIRAENDRQLLDHLRDKELLLVLDNCEDPATKVAKHLRAFLENVFKAGGVRALLSSRMWVGGPSGVSEQKLELRRLHDIEAARLLARLVGDRVRGQLFIELGARSYDEGIRRLAAHELAALLGGQPLAITLIAPLLADRTLEEVTHRVRERKAEAAVDESLPAEERDQRTSLTASLEVSIEIVRAERQHGQAALRLFGLMGLVPGGALPPDLDAIWGEGWREPADVLVNHSLVQRDALGAIAHYTTLPLLADFAERQLSTEDLARFSLRAAEHFAALSTEYYDSLRENRRTFSDVRKLLWIEADNMAACLSPVRCTIVAAASTTSSPLGVISRQLALLMLLTDNPGGALHVASAGLEAVRDLGDRAGEARVLLALGDVLMRMDDLKGAGLDYDSALTIYRQIGDGSGEACSLLALGNIRVRDDDLAGARKDYRAALDIFRTVEAPLGEANTLKALGDLNVREDDLASASNDYESSVPLYRKIEDRLGEANALMALGYLKLREGNSDGARELNETALALYRQIDDRLGVANALMALSDLKEYENDLDGARRDCQTALSIFRQINSRLGEANALKRLGNLLLAAGKAEDASALLRQSLLIHVGIDNQLGVGACLNYLARAAMATGGFAQAAVLAADALHIFRTIDDRFGQALVLLDQAECLWQTEAKIPAMAAWWQARELFRAIGDERNAERPDTLLAQIEQQAGSQWPALQADLAANAEAIRAEAIEQLRKAMEDQGGAPAQ